MLQASSCFRRRLGQDRRFIKASGESPGSWTSVHRRIQQIGWEIWRAESLTREILRYLERTQVAYWRRTIGVQWRQRQVWEWLGWSEASWRHPPQNNKSQADRTFRWHKRQRHETECGRIAGAHLFQINFPSKTVKSTWAEKSSYFLVNTALASLSLAWRLTHNEWHARYDDSSSKVFMYEACSKAKRLLSNRRLQLIKGLYTEDHCFLMWAAYSPFND